MKTINSNQEYSLKVVRQFTLATIAWGVIGMIFGVILASQLVWPVLNFDTPWFSFGRLRPVHTTLVIFAFGGSALFATSLYVVQRTCSARLPSDFWAQVLFWGWQLMLVLIVASYAMGMTTSKEYAEMEWPLSIMLTFLWLVYSWLFFTTIARRKTAHIYVANWFYGAFIFVTAMVFVVNSLAIPVSAGKSYPLYSGATDALIQWWYGHSVVGFILSVGFLGMMYYFIPRQAQRPIYSYRLSIVHFWAIISIYIWAGPHHLHYTALPDWAQSLGMVMSVILLAPSWGGMINGMMTLSGAWYKLRHDAVLRFLVVSLAFYGMSTFEGPMMAIKTVNSLSHYTDWTIGHVHAGALGWVAMITIGSLYYLIPALWQRDCMYSDKLVHVHFWLACVGTVIYLAAMWVNGISQGLMWRAVDQDGYLSYSFVETIATSHYGYVARLIGGALFASGMLLLALNCWLTLRKPSVQPGMSGQPVSQSGQ